MHENVNKLDFEEFEHFNKILKETSFASRIIQNVPIVIDREILFYKYKSLENILSAITNLGVVVFNIAKELDNVSR